MVSQDSFLLYSLRPVASFVRHEYGFLFLFLACPEPLYLDDTDWLLAIAPPRLTFVESTAVGGQVERRVLFDNALDVDVALFPATVLDHFSRSGLPDPIDMFAQVATPVAAALQMTYPDATHSYDTAGKRAPGRFGGRKPSKKKLLMLLFASFAGKKKHQKRAIRVPQAPAVLADELASRMSYVHTWIEEHESSIP